ncbi:MAG: hypothetical protein AVDCRST_MAG69-896, partial [uncultured Solirubrobacteraceae bacterium]
AGSDGSRRRRALRGQVPRRGPGPADPRGRAPGRVPRAPPRPAGARGRPRRARRGAGRGGARSRDPGPHQRQRRDQRGPRLPARVAGLRAQQRLPRPPGAGGRHRLVRRPHGQRRPDRAQPEPAAVAWPAVAHRPRRGAVSPARRLQAGGRRPACVRSRRPARPAAGRRLDRGRRRATRRPDRQRSARGAGRRDPARMAVGARCATPWRLRGVPARATRGTAALRGGGRACPPLV